MQINVYAANIFFNTAHTGAVKALFRKHLGSLPSNVFSSFNSSLTPNRENSGESCCHVSFSHTAENEKTYGEIEKNVVALWIALGPLLNKPAEMLIVDEDGNEAMHFTGPTTSSVDALKAKVMSDRIQDVIEFIGGAGVQDPVVAQQIGQLQALLGDIAQKNADKLISQSTENQNSAAAIAAKAPPNETGLATSNKNALQKISVFVLAQNSEGNPELLVTEVVATQEQYWNGEHYEMAQRMAVQNGYELTNTFDENDPAAYAVNKSLCFDLTSDEQASGDGESPTST